MTTKTTVFTPEQVIKHIAGKLGTNVKMFSIVYFLNEDFRKQVDCTLKDINERREENGFQKVIVSPEYFESIKHLAEQL